ncbi:protein PYRICULARIA ORYZAE RESISTANCE 21-like [Glycine soja]|uniref:protein PYRICULARIA ORYZAE RESISTANCE 21 n=1 Tax=Glycine max TaxID=3847 RepID=UPI0003DEC520|nr:protein PYRICULARIA ORYZAE RESISTANCE 21 [Glycine max]XP_028241936.1 protein PYRICULARIA ORYZAE RESISTANCE 21-like [Glycine soja]|eukprot:XP_006584100.1 protein PYRICULARIA ORYZAE RESISTANCE 21 [Glycine max]
MAKKVNIMRLKVDLGCHKCYKKVKKILCKFPREKIRDQVYDEKNNIVTIAVVCCNPEKLRDKICCKGYGTIKSIEIC